MSYLDHRQLAAAMDIFVFHEEIGAGLPLWMPNGVVIRDALESFVRELESRAGYQRVVSPHIGKSSLYEKSGHLCHFREDMFPPLQEGNDAFYLKPMNCPHHHLAYAARLRSYRSLPFRIAEYGQVYRNENSGSLQGLSRVRGLCQNDAHIYVDPQGAMEEIKGVLELHEHCYRALGLEGYRYRLSLRDPASFSGPEIRWLQAEGILRQALAEKGLSFFEAAGEAAFYGPKIDVQMRLGNKEESIASVQLDFLSPERFDLSFIGRSGERMRPWVIHRAPLGSHERMLALLLEYYQGRLPGWLSPVQLMVLPVSENDGPHAKRVVEKLVAGGVRARIDEGAGSLGKRLRLAHELRPFAILVLGPRERVSGSFSVRFREEVRQVWEANLLDELSPLLAKPELPGNQQWG